MLRMNFMKMDEAGEGEAGGGGAEVTLESLQADVAKLNESLAAKDEKIEKLTSHNETLFNETKAAKTAREKAEQEAREISAAKAKKDGNFEELYNSERQVSESLRGELDSTKSGIANKDKSAAAMKLASVLAEGVNVELLSEQIQKRLKTEDGNLMVTDKTGKLSSMSLEDLGKEIAGDRRFASLVKGNQSAGSGATDQNGNKGGGTAKEMTRVEFDNLSPAAKMKFIRVDKGKVVDA